MLHTIFNASSPGARSNWSIASKASVVHGVHTSIRVSDPTVISIHSALAGGYYRHEKGYTPDFPGMNDFTGAIVHPQEWPEDLDYHDKNVVVIGSGATAATLVPAMAQDCRHITML